MTFFRSSSAAVSSEKNLEQDTLLLKDIAAVRSDSPFACLRVGTLLPINVPAVTDQSLAGSRLERSRWRGGRFACYAPHVMPQRSAFNSGFRFSLYFLSRAKSIDYRGKKIQFP